MSKTKKLNMDDIDWIDDSMMPSAEEAANYPPLPEEIKKALKGLKMK